MHHKAFQLLSCFVRHPETTLPRDQILQDAWETVLVGTRLIVDNQVHLLLMSLEEDLHASG